MPWCRDFRRTQQRRPNNLHIFHTCVRRKQTCECRRSMKFVYNSCCIQKMLRHSSGLMQLRHASTCLAQGPRKRHNWSTGEESPGQVLFTHRNNTAVCRAVSPGKELQITDCRNRDVACSTVTTVSTSTALTLDRESGEMMMMMMMME
jgi:hypothetical protein